MKSFVHEFILVGLMATLFIVGGKVIFTKYHIPGVSEIFQNA